MHTATYIKRQEHSLCVWSHTRLLNGIHDDCFLCIVTVVYCFWCRGKAPKHISLNRTWKGRCFCVLTLTDVSIYAVLVHICLAFLRCVSSVCVYGTLSITAEIFDVWHEDIQSFESRSCRRPLTMPLSCDTTDLLSICSDANSCPAHQPKSRMEPLPWRCNLWRVRRVEKWRRERRKNLACPRRRSLYCRANSPNWLYRLAKQVRGTSCGQLRGDIIWKDK